MPSFLVARQNPLDDAKQTFSSWDGCMAKVYCKWPVIVGIVVGSLIILSIVACIARCICCGAECACCCLRCCGCCGGSSSRKSGHKRMNSDPKAAYPVAPYPAPYPAPTPHAEQYRSNPVPTFNSAPAPERPQYATFANPSKPVNADALPAMPTWGEGRDVHVEVEEPAPMPEKRGDVEMDRLNHNGSVANSSMARPGRSSPMQQSPTGDRYGHQNDSFASAGPQRSNTSPYGRPDPQQDDYRRPSPGPRSPVHAAYGRQSPAPLQHQQERQYQDPYHQPDQQYRSASPQHHYNQNPSSYDTLSRPQQPSISPGGYHSQWHSTHYEPPSPMSAYPGQRAYDSGPPSPVYPGQQTYQAFQPPPSPHHNHSADPSRKAMNGSYREI